MIVERLSGFGSLSWLEAVIEMRSQVLQTLRFPISQVILKSLKN